MNPDVITIQDCLDMYILKGQETILNDGKVTGFSDSSKEQASRTNRKA